MEWPSNAYVAPVHQHDDRRIGAWEMLRLAGGALHHVARRFDGADAAANAAETMPRAPVHQPARMRQNGRLGLRHAPADGAKIDKCADRFRQQRHRILGGADVDGEHRPVVEQSEKRPGTVAHAQLRRGLAGDVDGFRRAGVHAGHQVAVAPDRNEQAVRVVQLLLDPGVILPPRGDAVER